MRAEAKYDGRLIGTWRSDRRRTFQYFRPKAGCPPQALRRLKAMFGKLVVRWGRGRCCTEYNGYREAGAYEVIARGESSVVVCHEHAVPFLDRLQHIHFEGDWYWVAASGSLIEWFRRVK